MIAVSSLGAWWRSLDRWSLMAIIGLAAVGMVLVSASSPAVARRLDIDAFYFIYRQGIILPIALMMMVGLSFFTAQFINRLALLVMVIGVPLLILTLIQGSDIKGASRWLNIAGFSLQPIELIKPAFAVISAAIIARSSAIPLFQLWAVALWLGLITLLVMQPDIGQSLLLSTVLFAQMALVHQAGFVLLALILIGGGATLAYGIMPHVESRVDAFLSGSGDLYQLTTSYRAFAHGGLFGVGPGQGQVKHHLPDAHSDFIFAVAAEEFGVITCLVILFLIALIVVRSWVCLRGHLTSRGGADYRVILACCGLLVTFAGQAAINIASTVGLIPTKGITLPFISYGGSSLIGAGLTMGMLLALTARRQSSALPANANLGWGA